MPLPLLSLTPMLLLPPLVRIAGVIVPELLDEHAIDVDGSAVSEKSLGAQPQRIDLEESLPPVRIETMTASSPDHRVRESFARQELMRTLGAELVEVLDGEVRVRLPASQRISQQHGFAHAGAIATIADSACGYACLTKMAGGDAVLSVEFKINLLAPAVGDSFLAVGKAVRVGQTISVATAEVFAEVSQGATKCIAVMQATMMRVQPKSGMSG